MNFRHLNFLVFSDLKPFPTSENIRDVCYLFSAAKYFSIMKIEVQKI